MKKTEVDNLLSISVAEQSAERLNKEVGSHALLGNIMILNGDLHCTN